MLLGVFFWCFAAITVIIFLSRTWWTPDLASQHGHLVDDQLAITLFVAGTVFFLAHLLLGWFIWRYGARGDRPARYWAENGKLEAAWTIATAILFTGLAIQGNRMWAGYVRQPIAKDALPIEVTAQQFAWNIRYAGADGRFGRISPKLIDDSVGNYVGIDPEDGAGSDDVLTQNVITLPVGRPVHIVLRSKDVIHSFFVPQLRVKQDAVPGLSIPVQFTVTKAGEYEVACAELCGMQHHKMRARLRAMSDGEFQSWLKARSNQQ